MIDEQINTFMASGQFRRRAAELESEIGADIALGKPVNLGDVGARRAGRAHARRVSAWFADFIMRNGETLVTPNGGHNEPRPPLR